MQQTVEAARRQHRIHRPHLRKMTWALIVWTAVMAAWIISGAISAGQNANCAGDSTCQDATAAGAGIAVFALVVVWFLIFVPLALVWLGTRRKGDR